MDNLLTIDNLRNRIIELRGKSQDAQFNQYITQLMNDLDTGRSTVEQVAAEVERVYQIYLGRLGQQEPAPAPVHVPVQPVSVSKAENTAAEKEDTTDGAEYTIGATIIGIVGSIFLLAGFITFSINYLEGFLQAILLYIVSLLIILVSEFVVKRKLPKFSYVLTALGITALYATTIILRFQNQVEFLVATGVLFLVNATSVLLPSDKHNEIIRKIHMGLNTVFILVFVTYARKDGIMDVYLILCLILNIVLLNIVNLKQKKDAVTSILYGIEAGLLGIMTLSFLNDLTHAFQLMQQRIYYLVLVYVLITAVCIFFYVISRDKIGKAYQYYFFVAFTLLMLIDPIDKEYIWGMLILFVAVKLFSRVKEYEASNAMVTVFAFGAGIASHELWQTWLFFALALVSIPLIRRWRLFYQYTISIYLVVFASFVIPDFDQLFLPAAALVLFALVLLFRFLVRIQDKEEASVKQSTFHMIYNLTNLGMIGLISFMCIAADNAWTGSLVTVIGVAAIILYINPIFFIEFKKKHLLLAGYLIFMTLIIRFPNPVITSIILMIVAVVCVMAGFKLRDKAQRICGLVLVIFVCLKLALYDFRDLESLYQTIVFIVVGAFALLISLLYLRLEKTKPDKVGVENNGQQGYNGER